MKFEELVFLAVKKSGLSEEEVKHNIRLKQKEYNDLILEEDAAKLLLQELGITVPEEEPPLQWNTLKEISQQKIGEASTVVRILHMNSPKAFETAQKKGLVCNVEVADETGKGMLVLWDEDVWLMERAKWQRNDVLELRRVRVKNFNPLELHAALLSEFALAGEREAYPKNEQKLADFKQLEVGKDVDAVARVLEMGQLKEFEREGRKGKVLNVLLADPQGNLAKGVLWDYYADFANRRVHVGDLVKLESFSVKKNLEIELHGTWRSHVILSPEGYAAKTREEALTESAPATSIAELPKKKKGVVTATLQEIVSAEKKGEEVRVEAVLKDESGQERLEFKGREGLRILELKHVPRIPLELVLKLKAEHLKGKKVTVVVSEKKDKYEAEHVIKME